MARSVEGLGTCWLLIALGLSAGCDSGTPVGETGWFTDATQEVGLAAFVHETGARGGLHLPEIMGGGVALADLDGDGDLDALLASGGPGSGPGPSVEGPGCRLFLQGPDGSFVDRTAGSGLEGGGYGLGLALGDIDNDGDLDLHLSEFGADRLYRNRGDGSFEDVTELAGISVRGFSCSAVFCDYDRDGFLDLYVTRYVRYDPARSCTDSAGRPDYCNPRAFMPASDVLLHNERNGTFADVSRAAGLEAKAAPGLGVVCEDLDGDGLPDFYVANDRSANHLWINRGGGVFEERAVLLGAAYDLAGQAEAGMGVVAADLDGDLDLDLFVTNLEKESNTFYRNRGAGQFEDATGGAGLAQGSLPYTGFGTVAFDVELDGDLDLLVANGRVMRGRPDPHCTLAAAWCPYAERNSLYLNQGGGRFDSRPDLGEAFTRSFEIARGLAAGDVEGDGDVDVLVGNAQSRARLYRNDAPRQGAWLAVRAVDPRLGRDAIGARIVLIGDASRQLRTITTGFSYLSSSEPRAHFGLGRRSRPERVEVRWPDDGLVESFVVPGVDRELRLARGQGERVP